MENEQKIDWDKLLICCDYVLNKDNLWDDNKNLKFFYWTDSKEDEKLAKILPHFKLILEDSFIPYFAEDLTKEISNFMGWDGKFYFLTTYYNKKKFNFKFVDPRL